MKSGKVAVHTTTSKWPFWVLSNDVAKLPPVSAESRMSRSPHPVLFVLLLLMEPAMAQESQSTKVENPALVHAPICTN